MDQRTLTDRLGYLIEKGILFEVGGDKGATGYGFNFLLNNPEWKRMIGEQVDAWSPKKKTIILLGLPIKPVTDHQRLIDGLRNTRDSIELWYRGAESQKKIREQKRNMRLIYNIAIEYERRKLREQQRKG